MRVNCAKISRHEKRIAYEPLNIPECESLCISLNGLQMIQFFLYFAICFTYSIGIYFVGVTPSGWQFVDIQCQ